MRLASRLFVAAMASLLAVTAVAAGAQAAPPGAGKIRVTFSTPEGVAGLLTLTNGAERLVATKATGGTVQTVELSATSGRFSLGAKPVMAGTKRYVAVTNPLNDIQVQPNATAEVKVTYALSRGVQEVHQVGLAPDSVRLRWAAPVGTKVLVRRMVGDSPAMNPSQGSAVRSDALGLVDQGLRPGTRYTYSFWATPGDSAFGVSQAAGPVTLTVGTSDPANPGTASYVVRPGTLLARAEQVLSSEPADNGVQVVFADGVDVPAPGSAVVLPISDSLRGGYLGVVTSVSVDGRAVRLEAGGIGDAFDFYHLDVPNLSVLPLESINAPDVEAGSVPVGQSAGVLPAGTAMQSTPTASSALSSRAGRLGAAQGTQTAKLSALAVPAQEVPTGTTECKKWSGSGEGIAFDPGMELAGHFRTTVDKYNFLGASLPTGMSLDMQAAVTLSGAMTAKMSVSVSCTIRLPKVMVKLPSGPVPMAFYFMPTAKVSVAGAIQVSNLGAAVTLGFAADGYVGFNGDNNFNGRLINEANLLTPQVDNVAGGLTSKVGGDVLIGPGAGSEKVGVIAGIGGTFVPIDAKAMVVVPTTPGSSPCLTLDFGGQVGVLLSARAFLGPVDFKADYLIPGLSKKFSYLPEPWRWPTACDEVLNPSDDVLGDGVTKVEDGVDGDSAQWGYLDGFAPGSKAWVLSTGYISQATGTPGTTASSDLGRPGNAALSSYSGFGTFDAAAYRVKLIPTGDTLHVRYVFASEEYPEWVGSSYNDVMAVFVNGKNCAHVPGTTTPVSINSINDRTNASFYVDNRTGASGYNTSFDGLTSPLECSVPVVPGVPVDVEIAVADASDHILDTAVALLDKGIWSD